MTLMFTCVSNTSGDSSSDGATDVEILCEGSRSDAGQHTRSAAGNVTVNCSCELRVLVYPMPHFTLVNYGSMARVDANPPWTT